MTLDAQNAYFVSDGYVAQPNAVYQLGRSGGTPLRLGLADEHFPVAVYGSNVYFVPGNSIATAPVGGGTQATFVTDAGPPTTFAVDGSTLYWTCTSCGTVSKHGFTGGTTTTLASGEHAPEYLAVDAARLYRGATGAIRYKLK